MLSSRALRELVCFCNEMALAKGRGQTDNHILDEEPAMIILYVSGRGPVLLDEDRRWFEQNAQDTSVYWRVSDKHGKEQIFSTTMLSH